MPTVEIDIGQDAELFVGEDKTLTFTVKNEAGVVVDIGSWTLVFEVRLNRYTPGAALLAKTTGAGITTPNPTDGVLAIDIDSADTEDMKAGTYHYGVARTNPGAFDVVAEGMFVLRKAAVRA